MLGIDSWLETMYIISMEENVENMLSRGTQKLILNYLETKYILHFFSFTVPVNITERFDRVFVW